MLRFEELWEKLQQEELPFWGTWQGEHDYPSIKEARKAGLTDQADSAIEHWKNILELPMPAMANLGIMEYESANFSDGAYMQENSEWQRFHEIFEGKHTFPVEYVVERALIFPEAFNMLMDMVV